MRRPRERWVLPTRSQEVYRDCQTPRCFTVSAANLESAAAEPASAGGAGGGGGGGCSWLGTGSTATGGGGTTEGGGGGGDKSEDPAALLKKAFAAQPTSGELKLKAGVDFHLAFSPERVDPGRTDYTLRTTPTGPAGSGFGCSGSGSGWIPSSQAKLREAAAVARNAFT